MNIRKTTLCFQTVLRMKPSQVLYRIRKKLGLRCTIGCGVQGSPDQVHPVATIPELDFDPVFLSRFSSEELLRDRVTFLHASQEMDWDGSWQIREQSALWNFNLHYFEFLFPLWSAFLKTGDRRYADKAEALIRSWIRRNPRREGGYGWSPYTIDLRLTHWLSFYAYAEKELSEDLKREMRASIHEQYAFLSEHVEKDILGNHYFEDLKTLVLCAVFFGDGKMLDCALDALKKECGEEILADGMHFERSPMYHKLVLEGLMKAAYTLRGCGRPDAELERHISPMLNAAWSMEESLHRLPLFNDAGSNVAKSLEALVLAAQKCFGISPVYRSSFPQAGFYLFKHGDWKMIADAGDPGPAYVPGHAHCDALSFELFRSGRPVLVNCGTYAYQTEKRGFFRSTAAHNTVCVDGREQSQCWDVFRVARRSSVRVTAADDRQLTAVMTDQAGCRVTRSFSFGKDLTVTDETAQGTLTAFLHPLEPVLTAFTAGTVREETQPYAPEYGAYSEIKACVYQGEKKISVRIRLNDGQGEEA